MTRHMFTVHHATIALLLTTLFSCYLCLITRDQIREGPLPFVLTNTTDCGNHEGIGTAVSPCTQEPCMMKKGTFFNLTIRFVANQNTKSGFVYVTVNFLGVDVEYDGVEQDLCKVTECPIKKGEIRTVTWQVPSHFYLPPIIAPMTFNVTGDKGTLLCGISMGGLEDD